RLLRVRHGDVDRVRDGGGGRHVRDRLEQHLRQADRVLAQTVEATRLAGGRVHGGFLLCRFLPRARVCHGWHERAAATLPAPGGVPERPKGTGCKPVGSAYGGSNPPAPIASRFGPWWFRRGRDGP